VRDGHLLLEWSSEGGIGNDASWDEVLEADRSAIYREPTCFYKPFLLGNCLESWQFYIYSRATHGTVRTYHKLSLDFVIR
jgi:hypothetical protein